ncbi:MAG: sigma-54-dependent Fis family transcriptional regulator [Nevskia sp.]|nr:sigma-54-dependent Fis family transcriptional regulator [Nevskia sp.]
MNSNGRMNDIQNSALHGLMSYIENEAQPMIVLDVDYNILAANAAYQRQFGAERPYVGRKCYQISHGYKLPCDQAGEHCPMRKAAATLGPDRVLHIHHTPRGPEHVDVELRPILNPQREIIAYVERLTSVSSASAKPSQNGLVGRSAAFVAALATLQRAAPSQIPVLLLGESGTGKELFARALHQSSSRAQGPLVIVDCTGLSETLFESELFGHERGAFTGAAQRKIGLAETAHGGTLFLDEIGDVPLAMQVKLLRLIESGTFRRVGGVDTLRADFRLVAATHKPLREMVAQQTFRQDLYYRISAFPVRLPALRERRDDIPLLVESLLQRVAGETPMTVERAAMQQLTQYDYPGNIRELRNILDRARLFADDGVIRARDLPPELLTSPQLAAAPVHRAAVRPDAEKMSFMQRIAGFSGSRGELAAHLGLSERTLYRRLKQYGLV